MPIHVIEGNENYRKRPSFMQSLLGGAMQAIPGAIQQYQQQKQQAQRMQQENEQIKNQFGIDLTGVNDPKLRQEYVSASLQGANQQQLERLKEEGKQNRLNQKLSFTENILSGGEAEQHEDLSSKPGFEGIIKEPGTSPVKEKKKGFDPLKLSDETILLAEQMGIKGLRESQDAALKRQQHQIENDPENVRNKYLAQSQAESDAKYYNDLQSRRGKQIIKKESLNRLKAINKKGVSGKPFEKILESTGLTSLTSSGRRELAAEVKNQLTDFKEIAGSQLSASEFFVLSGAYPSPDFSQEANEAIMENLDSVHDTLDKQDEIAKRLKKENKGKPPEYFQEKVNEELKEFISKKMDKIKENIKKIRNAEFGITPGNVLLFDQNGEPLNVPQDKVDYYIGLGAVEP